MPISNSFAVVPEIVGSSPAQVGGEAEAIVTPTATLAIGVADTVALFKEGSAEPAANRTAILEFMVGDVEAEFLRLKDQVTVVHEPKPMPWGNRTTMFRDPEGTAVALYQPVTDAAKARFAGR